MIDQLGLDPIRFDVMGGLPEVNQGLDPNAVNGIATPTWSLSTYDAATGVTTFDVDSVAALDNESLFQPAGTSPLQLLIASVDPANAKISCYGKWIDANPGNTKTGTIFDYHIPGGSSAADFGDGVYLTDANGAGDDCDLDGDQSTTDDLPFDLDGAVRAQNGNGQGGSEPDSGAYEVPGQP